MCTQQQQLFSVVVVGSLLSLFTYIYFLFSALRAEIEIDLQRARVCIIPQYTTIYI